MRTVGYFQYTVVAAQTSADVKLYTVDDKLYTVLCAQSLADVQLYTVDDKLYTVLCVQTPADVKLYTADDKLYTVLCMKTPADVQLHTVFGLHRTMDRQLYRAAAGQCLHVERRYTVYFLRYATVGKPSITRQQYVWDW